jgi:hypothetical protein
VQPLHGVGTRGNKLVRHDLVQNHPTPTEPTNQLLPTVESLFHLFLLARPRSLVNKHTLYFAVTGTLSFAPFLSNLKKPGRESINEPEGNGAKNDVNYGNMTNGRNLRTALTIVHEPAAEPPRRGMPHGMTVAICTV